ncbi:carboxypeptidase-like regulatory domain-containing protein [Bythopirellula polymerisocia]|uniref:Carboxypeptidase regulatory-like domain-containing protein n=1 Tax=Bythopirellula polymerisocia TaxID=2528003 RepID=A0A5C6CWX8_9BACT|nr:carboxypeptidase-like regulatory domain-containing protein [Bythopirellula polymerisocia]TWU28375.1 hypothetical protein Pla144_16630 [Bythopirellula polymerisocia]
MTRNKQIELLAQAYEAVVAPGKETGGLAITAIALFSLVLVGCGQGVEMAPVSGVVNVDGQPVAGAGVTFIPVDGGRPAWATTDEAGRFELSSKDPGDGARVGDYLVTLVDAPYPVSSGPELADPGLASVFEGRQQSRKNTKKTMIDLKYASRSTSDLRFTVVAEKENMAEFNFTNN